MQQLNENQWKALGRLYGLVKTANFELNDSLYTGNLQSSQSAITAVRSATHELELPDGLAHHFRLLAGQSLRHAEREGDSLHRAGLACCPIEQLEELLEDLFIEHGRMGLTRTR